MKTVNPMNHHQFGDGNIYCSHDLHDNLIDLAINYKDRFEKNWLSQKVCVPRSNIVMGTMFLEPSTRTRWSFESAMAKLGGHVISSESGKHTSALAKGETLSDTMKVVSQYVDVLVVRSPDPMTEWMTVGPMGLPYFELPCKIINAGDGHNEHPTQALTDLVTIYSKLGKVEKLKIGVIGDLERSRTIHSFISLMSRYDNEFVVYGGLSKFEWDGYPNDVQPCDNELQVIYDDLDVLYLNRIQAERWAEGSAPEPFILTEDHLDALPKTCIVMNPGPRREELPAELDSDPRIVYFEQARNGLYARMALLEYLFPA